MKRATGLIRAALLAIPAVVAGAATAAGQLPSASAAALGMGDNYTGFARGFNAAAWNPAGLGMANNPLVSFALLPGRAVVGLDPVSMADLKEYDGQLVPADVRERWLKEITAEGNEQGTAGADITFLSASVGRVALQVGTSGRAAGTLGPGISELILFGNAGRTGQPVDVTLEGSSFDVAVTTTGAISYGQPLIRTPDRSLAIGATLKYTFGNMVFTGEDQGGVVRADPLEVRLQFPAIVSDTVFVIDKLDNGHGVGLDLGAMYQTGPWSLGLAAKNVFNSFKWDESSLFFRPGEAVFNTNESESDFDPQPYSQAPTGLRDRVDRLVGQPEIAAGLAFQPNRRVLLTADVRRYLDEAPVGESKSHMGAGAELRPLSWLPLRVGGAILPGGSLLSGGVGLEFGVMNLTASAAQRETDLGTDHLFMVTFSSFRLK